MASFGTLAAFAFPGRGKSKRDWRSHQEQTGQTDGAPTYLTVDVLRASFFGLKKFAASGVDEMTWTEYTQGLEENFSGLHSRVQTAAYRALLSRRTYIPKADGRQRPLGIAALEDKTAQAAVVAILTPIYAAEAAASTVDYPLARKPKQAARGLPKPSAGDGAFEVGERAIGQCTRVGRTQRGRRGLPRMPPASGVRVGTQRHRV